MKSRFDRPGALKSRIGGMKRRDLDLAAQFRGRYMTVYGWYSPAELYNVLIQPASVSNTLTLLSRTERLILDLLVSSRGEISIGEIGSEIGQDTAETLKIVRPLSDCLMVEISADNIVRLYPEYLPLIELSPDNAGRLRFLLNGLSRKVLDDLVKANNLKPSGRAKSVAALTAEFSRYETLQQAFDALPVELRATIEEIVRVGGRTALRFQSEGQKELIHKLAGCVPFVFLFEPDSSGKQLYTAVVSREIQTAIQCGFHQVPRGSGIAMAAFLKQENRSVHRSDRYQGRASLDLIRYALFLARGEARLTQQRSISVPDIKKLQKRFPDAGDGNAESAGRQSNSANGQYGQFLLSMARTRGWYEFFNLVSRCTPKFVAESSSYDWMHLCLQAWIATTTWSECNGENTDAGDLQATRRAVLALLLECPEDEWLMTDRLGAAVMNRYPETEAAGGRATVHRMLTDPLTWIGICEAGEDAGDRSHLRLPVLPKIPSCSLVCSGSGQ